MAPAGQNPTFRPVGYEGKTYLEMGVEIPLPLHERYSLKAGRVFRATLMTDAEPYAGEGFDYGLILRKYHRDMGSVWDVSKRLIGGFFD